MPYPEIGKDAEALRNEKKLSQVDAAKAAGISQPLLCLIEKGERSLGPSVAALARVFGPKVFALAEDEESLNLRETEFRYKLAQGLFLVAHGACILGAWGGLSPAEEERLYREHLLQISWGRVLTDENVAARMDGFILHENPDRLDLRTFTPNERRGTLGGGRGAARDGEGSAGRAARNV